VRNERSRPHYKGDPANISSPRSIPNPCDSHPEIEEWVVHERAAIEAAVDARLALWARLGLKLPPRGEEVFRLARIHAAVDRCTVRRAR
jgi:hypothetical protein